METGTGLRRWRALACAWIVGTSVTAGGAPGPDAARLVYLLQYVGMDYERAVRDGRVVDPLEHGEVLRLTREVIAGYGGRADRVARGLRELETMLATLAPADRVRAAARDLVPLLTRALGVRAAVPSAIPDVASGRRLWRHDCSPCHGVTGSGDGPAASGMNPLPTAFRGEYLERLSPRQVFHAISFGMDGTAMPSFVPAYTEAQRWDVAFFVMTLRVEFNPKRPPELPRLDLATLAAASNEELLAKLRRARPDAPPGEVDWLRTNVVSPDGTVVPLAGPAATRHDGVATALDLQDAFASVAERVAPRVAGVTSWVRDPAWTPTSLQAEHGDEWIARNQDALRHPGFKPVRTGSALLVDDDGFLLSADHLVRAGAEPFVDLIEVEIDSRFFVAGVVGAEPTLDLVVLKLAEPLPPGPRPPPARSP